MPPDPEVKCVDLVIKETNREITLESTNTYKKNCLNGHRIISLNLCDSTENEDYLFDLKKITVNVSKVTCLTLSHCKLSDIPTYLSGLLLRTLDLSHNALKTVPICILNGLAFLENLNLSNNYIAKFETEPKCVTRLHILNLSHNNMNLIPLWIITARSVSLRELYYSHNKIGHTCESEYENVAVCNLVKLDLRNCCVRSDNLQFLKSVPTLTNLNLSNDSCVSKNSFTDYEVFFDDPVWRNRIEILNLNRLMISFLPDTMSALSNLKELYLSENDIFWLPDYLAEFSKLEILDLSKNMITRLPANLNKMRNLRVLKAQCNNISSVPDICNLPNLNVLDLYQNDLEVFLYNVENFEWIDLEQNLFGTSILGDEYADKRNSFRFNNKLEDRLSGWKDSAESFDQDSESTSSFESSSSCSFNADFECIHLNGSIDEEESWDTEKFKSHPDVTTSDEEWQGHFEIVKKKRVTRLVKLHKNFDIVFADAD